MNRVLGRKIAHCGNPVLRWNADNVVVETDPAENIKPSKAKAKQRIDGMVATIMALSRAIVHEEKPEWNGEIKVIDDED
jgi:phage terminase large subunit-like protein